MTTQISLKTLVKPGIFDTNPIALANAYSFNYELMEEGADVILDIGNSTTNIIVWGKNIFSQEL